MNSVASFCHLPHMHCRRSPRLKMSKIRVDIYAPCRQPADMGEQVGGRGREDRGNGQSAAAPAASATATASDSGLLRQLLEGAQSTIDRLKSAFARYRAAADGKIAELSFAVVFKQAENDILSNRLASARGEASSERARPTA